MLNRAKFYDSVRASLFRGKIAQHQVDGTDLILDAWETAPMLRPGRTEPDLRWLAYMLATAFHETAKTMQPIKEFGLGHGHRYGIPDPETGHTYYGRGLVQLTWRDNYEKFSKLLGIDLVHDPNKACDPHVAVEVMRIGMRDGLFTGKKLSGYFGGTVENWVEARRIINGTDCAEQIADYGRKFYAALKDAS